MNSVSIRKMTGVGLFTAAIVVLQLLGSFIRFGLFSVSLVLLPIVVGAALYGVAAGAWMGFAFGVVVLLSGDASAFLAVDPLGTVLTVLVKGTLAGIGAGMTYRAISPKNEPAAVASAAIVCPVINTGIFFLGCVLFFMDTVSAWGEAMGFGDNVVGYMFLGLAGWNFLFELLCNLIFCPVIVRLIRYGAIMGVQKRA